MCIRSMAVETRNILGQILGQQPRIKIIRIARLAADDPRDGFALIERRRLRRRLFKVQRVQEFKGQKEQSDSNPIEHLNF